MTRVLHVIAAISPVYGGPSVAVIEMCKALISKGVSAEIATTTAHGASNAEESSVRTWADGIPVHVFPRVRPYMFMTSPALKSWLVHHVRDYDVLHVHALFLHPITAACQAAHRAGVPYILRPLGLLDPWCLNQNPVRKRAYYWLADRSNLARASALHFTSDVESEKSLRIPPAARKVVIPLGAPVLPNLSIRDRDAFRQEHGVRPDETAILFLSRVDVKKGFDLLLPALSELRRGGTPFKLLVAGPGEEVFLRRVESMVRRHDLASHVVLLGMVKGSAKEELLTHSDLFVLPSYQENFAIAAVEAMQHGLPVIISDRVGIHPVVIRYGAGEVVPCSVPDLKDALLRLIDSPERRVAMGRQARTLVEKEFSWDEIAVRLIALYDSVSAGRRVAGITPPSAA